MLEVPGHALKHLSTGTHKVRVSEAKVVDIMYTDLSPLKFSRIDRILYKISVRSGHDRNFVYKVGETVKPTLQFNDSDETCSSGIHGFRDVKDALNYII